MSKFNRTVCREPMHCASVPASVTHSATFRLLLPEETRSVFEHAHGARASAVTLQRQANT